MTKRQIKKLVAEREAEVSYAHQLYCIALSEYKHCSTSDTRRELEISNRRHIMANRRLDLAYEMLAS